MGLIKNFNKTIHQIWWQGEDDFKSRNIVIKPQNSVEEFLSLADCQKTYIDFCNSSDWSYKFWDKEKCLDLVKKEFPQYFEAFQSIKKGVIKYDCVRAMILYVDGGLYVDLDTYLTQDLNEFLDIEYIEYDGKELLVAQNPQYGISDRVKTRSDYLAIFAQEPYIQEYYYNLYGVRVNKVANSVMFSSKKYSMWLDLLESGFSKSQNLHVLDYFGPSALHNLVTKKILENTEVLIQSGTLKVEDGDDLCSGLNGVEILVTPKEYFQQTRKTDNPNQYIVHKFEGSWMPK